MDELSMVGGRDRDDDMDIHRDTTVLTQGWTFDCSRAAECMATCMDTHGSMQVAANSHQ